MFLFIEGGMKNSMTGDFLAQSNRTWRREIGDVEGIFPPRKGNDCKVGLQLELEHRARVSYVTYLEASFLLSGVLTPTEE